MNIDELLAPISEAAPCGEDLSFSAEFDAIAELRREDDPTLAQGAWVTALKTADWPTVQTRCAELLARRAKDLRLAMWWAEAAALTQGYAGLQQGLSLCSQLCERYWDGLYPLIEGGDLEQRVGNIGWLIKRVAALAYEAPLTHGRAGSFSLKQMQSARALQATLERAPDKASGLPADVVTLEKFNRALRDTPQDELRQMLATLQACLEALAAWQAVVDPRLGADGPSFVPAREALASALHEAKRLAREVGALSGPEAASEAAHSAAAAQAPGGAVRTRQQALAQLREVAAFFRATEPHSPVAYLADKAVQWGDMPLHQWLRTVVKDGAALAHLEELLGLEPRRDSAA